MKVAVVTPYYDEDDRILRRCHDSVKAQTHPYTHHIMVADGKPNSSVGALDAEHVILPASHADAGATPRAIGAMSAFSRGYDAVAFLDADNWYEPHHIKTMVEIASPGQFDAIVATRTIHALDGSPMYVDNIESNGQNMVDTNSWFLLPACMPYLHAWVVPQAQRLWSDRYFGHAILHSNMRVARCYTPTVAYVTRWAWHYQHAGKAIPDDAVWIDSTSDGTLIHRRHADKLQGGFADVARDNIHQG